MSHTFIAGGKVIEPRINIRVSFQSDRAQKAMKTIVSMAKNMGLRIQMNQMMPDPNFKDKTYYDFDVSANWKLETPQDLVDAANTITMFQQMFHTQVGFAELNQQETERSKEYMDKIFTPSGKPAKKDKE